MQKKQNMNSEYLIESDSFAFDFLSDIAETESWRKEIYRPIYHVHKWWATRLGSVFRGILLACQLSCDSNLEEEFYNRHDFADKVIFDPFMGSGTTIGEAHMLGYTALGRDINPVAVQAASVGLGSLDKVSIISAFKQVKDNISERLRNLYSTQDELANTCDVLYYFWVKTVDCPKCKYNIDLFSSYIIARNASPLRNPTVQVICPFCGDIFPSIYNANNETCPKCNKHFNPQYGTAHGAKAICPCCSFDFPIAKTILSSGKPPRHRLFGKLILRPNGQKAYLPSTDDDNIAYIKASGELKKENLLLPKLDIKDGYNTRQVLNYGYQSWRDFFNDRQLLALGLLQNAIMSIQNEDARVPLLTVFSGVLEFNNMFASYKGEGTGAVRHMFSHHILKPERTPIEANVWGTEKSSGSFSTLFKTRLLRCIDYQKNPFEVVPYSSRAKSSHSKIYGSSIPFTQKVVNFLPESDSLTKHAVYISSGSSHRTELPNESVDFIVTDPPFFDNVHYSELADFFYAWQQINHKHIRSPIESTRQHDEVQDKNANQFTKKLKSVLCECNRVLKNDGILVFTYHHSRYDSWFSLCEACVDSGFHFVNAHPIKSEMSVATPKSQAKEPIDIDIILVCRKIYSDHRNLTDENVLWDKTMQRSKNKADKYLNKPRRFSVNDMKIILISQLLVEICPGRNIEEILNFLKTMTSRIDSSAQFLFKKCNVSENSTPHTSQQLNYVQLNLF